MAGTVLVSGATDARPTVDARRPVVGTVRRRLTPRGWSLLGVGALAAVAALVAQELELLVVAGVCLTVPLLAALWVSGRRTRLGGELLARPHALDVGDTGDLVLTLRRESGLPAATAQIVVDGPVGRSPDSPVEVLGRDRLEATPRRDRPVTVELAFRARRRGLANVAGPLVRFTDPFGLWVEEHAPVAPAPVLVLPPVVELEGLPPGLARGRSGRLADGSGEPDVVVRPYVPGDDIRTIHWRASARLDGDLVVRLRETGAARSVALLLDDRPGAYSGPGLETAVSLAASVGARIRRAGLPLTVSDAAGHVLIDGEEDPERLLVALAMVGAEQIDARAFTPEVTGRPELVVAVLGGAATDADAAWLHRLAPGVTGLAFRVVDDVTSVRRADATSRRDSGRGGSGSGESGPGAAAGLPAGWRVVHVAAPPTLDGLVPAVTHAWDAAVRGGGS
ncbi:uncharacterized protein (DUF58 family) [Salana multivorans]|uniref:Uncharacterized protein (DUF58 family) n=1 Tax=Salana multivorans TaxID=120377 RepID=A0A3N2D9N9_9MICO|nr:DUF58 domain-containing protein [Salana multivorans]ROR96516.1 uncharacterized protein (DUF58 family) [Salana multivorans]